MIHFISQSLMMYSTCSGFNSFVRGTNTYCVDKIAKIATTWSIPLFE